MKCFKQYTWYIKYVVCKRYAHTMDTKVSL